MEEKVVRNLLERLYVGVYTSAPAIASLVGVSESDVVEVMASTTNIRIYSSESEHYQLDCAEYNRYGSLSVRAIHPMRRLGYTFVWNGNIGGINYYIITDANYEAKIFTHNELLTFILAKIG